MNDNNNSSKMLSDDALERVMLDMFGGGVFGSPKQNTRHESPEMDSRQSALIDETEDNL